MNYDELVKKIKEDEEKLKEDKEKVDKILSDIAEEKDLEFYEMEDGYYANMYSCYWELENVRRKFSIRIFLSDKYGIEVEYGNITYIKEKYQERLERMIGKDRYLPNTYDQIYPPQDEILIRFKTNELEELKKELEWAFE